MDNLIIDVQSLLPYVIDSLTTVFGKEYQSIISKRMNNSIIVQYHDVGGLDNYIDYLEGCKKRELSIQFLEQIGVDVKKYKKDNYTECLDNEVKDIIDHCLCSSDLGFGDKYEIFAPLMAFDSTNKYYNHIEHKERFQNNRIALINYLTGNDYPEVTKENFEEFTKTEKYLEILKSINKMLEIYKQLLLEYKKWQTQLLPCKEYVQSETKRKDTILEKYKNELWEEIYDKLPMIVKDALSNKTLEEQRQAILGKFDIASKSKIEYFDLKDKEELENPDSDIYSKYFIVFQQSDYLTGLGITIPDKEMLQCNSQDDVNRYLNFLNQYNMQKYLPSDELIHYITETRTKKYEEVIKEYYTTRQDFIEIYKNFGNNHNDFTLFYNHLREKAVCILGGGIILDLDEWKSIMFYTIREYGDGGCLSFNFLHESGHIISHNRKGCGFETNITYEDWYEKNSYDKSCRKYEKFNETLNDIFILEAVEYLENKGIYLIEPKKFTKLDRSNNNTNQITKNLLYPLLQRFRKQVVDAYINVEPERLVAYIGKENFEELVDAVNHVDYLSSNGVLRELDNPSNEENEMVLEYYQELERIKQIYINIDSYYTSNFDNSFTDSMEDVKKSR